MACPRCMRWWGIVLIVAVIGLYFAWRKPTA